MGMTKPDYSIEQAAGRRGILRIAGVDEVGRGPLAGPVVAAAVILNPKDIPEGLNDSKKLTAKRRVAMDAAVRDRAEFAIAEASVAEIDEHNILRASHLAMERAVAALNPAAGLFADRWKHDPAGSDDPGAGGCQRRCAFGVDCGGFDHS